MAESSARSKGDTMSIQEANYWNGEISDAEIDMEADAGDFLFAAEALVYWNKLSEFEDAI
jgi:hypothetical protein